MDTYDREHLDEGAYDTIDPEARVAAEKAMRKRDRQVHVGGHTITISCLCAILTLYVFGQNSTLKTQNLLYKLVLKYALYSDT